jgi:hypothetical protein
MPGGLKPFFPIYRVIGPEIPPGSERYMPYILELDTFRYLPVAHIHRAHDLKGSEYVAQLQAQLLQVDRYLLDQEWKA